LWRLLRKENPELKRRPLMSNKADKNLSYGMGTNAEEVSVAATDYIPSTDAGKNGFTIYVGTTGNVALKTLTGDAVVLSTVLGGTFVPVICSQITKTGTTAGGIVALW